SHIICEGLCASASGSSFGPGPCHPDHPTRWRIALTITKLIQIGDEPGSIKGLTRYHAPHAASWVLHIALTTRNEMYVSVANSLSSNFTAVYPNVEAAH